jgi:TetR/AcrR family transcriptional regulator, transcriptional repressor for nem operon
MTKGEKTRNNIIAAAAAIFNQRGYEGSSMNDLMEATGLKKGGIYRHFANKEELAAEAFDYTWKAAWDTRMRDVEETMNGLDGLKQFITNFVETRPPVPGGCPVLNTAVDADDGNSVLRTRVVKALRFWLGRLQKFVERAQADGHARDDIDAQTLATVVVASLEGALMISRMQRNDDALRRVERHLNDYIDREVAVVRRAK